MSDPLPPQGDPPAGGPRAPADPRLSEALSEIDRLRESAGHYRSMVEKATDYFVIHQDGRIVFANQAAARALGFDSPEELVGLSPLEFVAPDEREAIAERMRLSIETGEELAPLEERYIGRHGHEVIGEVTARRVRWNGQPAGLVIVHDVTERLRAERERIRLIERIQRAEKLKSLGLFAAEVAHDFRNLLHVIAGNVGLVVEQLAPESPAIRHFEPIKLAIDRASEVIGQFQVMAGQGPPMRQPVDLAALARDTVGMLRAGLPAGIQLELDLESGGPPIPGDPGQLSQVLVNLVRNAIEALDGPSGKICLELGFREMDPSKLDVFFVDDPLPPGRYACLSVSDDGCGMEEGLLTRAFDPFISTKGPGRGLGLATVLGIVRSHRGALVLRTKPGDGTRVQVLLPVGPAA
jgi:PAS domain S-box-containing protein